MKKKKKKSKRVRFTKEKTKKTPRLGRAAARAKGHAFERAIAEELREIFPDVKRHLEMQASEAHGFDLDNTDPFLFQMKAFFNYASIGMIREIKAQKGKIPVLVTKGNNAPPVACMYFSDFKNLVKELLGRYTEVVVTKGESNGDRWENNLKQMDKDMGKVSYSIPVKAETVSIEDF